MRGPIFAMREFMTGSMTSIFYAIHIDGALRHFHAYCDLSDATSVQIIRAAIIARESPAVR
ncbi:DUF1419 domain-containing protein [Rhizobium sp. ZW T2_16]|jgi:hypothetical protein|uniref:DUF1419 domain-containing protein n=1 Tax=Rhizobium sp. ZW T2_16 TaxID=3378083 RepID=UPI003853BE86